jgi:hypothetical protein
MQDCELVKEIKPSLTPALKPSFEAGIDTPKRLDHAQEGYEEVCLCIRHVHPFTAFSFVLV